MRSFRDTRRWWIAAYLAVTFVCTTGWLVLGQRLAEETGLRRQVWLANDFQGAPVIDDVARSATLDFLDDDPRLPREFISARWHGYWYVPSRQSFTLHVYADDYADIWIDREQRFARSSAAARGVRLDAGVHELQVVYQQYAGAAHLAFYEGSGMRTRYRSEPATCFPVNRNRTSCGWRPLSTGCGSPSALFGPRVRSVPHSSSSGGDGPHVVCKTPLGRRRLPGWTL